jgi:hypothetical protein
MMAVNPSEVSSISTRLHGVTSHAAAQCEISLILPKLLSGNTPVTLVKTEGERDMPAEQKWIYFSAYVWNFISNRTHINIFICIW